jgi:hypothetical protein
LFYLYIVSVFLVKYPQINDKELLEEEKLAENCCNLKMNDYTVFKLNETETIREANKEELVIYETTNMVYEDLNELTQKIILKSVTDDDELNFESLALIESCHIVNQNDLSDLKSIQEEEEAEEEVTDNNNFIDEEQQTDDIIYCFDFKNMSSILINTEDEKDDTISISSFDNNNNNESNNSNSINNNNKKTEIINSSSPLPFEQIIGKYLNIL